MPEHHHLTLTVEHGELRRGFTCSAPPDALCRRRPVDEYAEFWTAEEATEPGHQCWATEWIDQIGIDYGLLVTGGGVLASVPVTIAYDHGVRATPIPEEEA